MQKAKKILFKFPEYYLVLILFLAGYTPPFTLNPIIGLLMIIPILQIVFRNKLTGLILGFLFLLINLYMLGALIFEFNEFITINNSALQLIIIGLSIWIISMLVSIIMIYKYSTSIDLNNVVKVTQN